MLRKFNLVSAFFLLINIIVSANTDKESDFNFIENKGQLNQVVKYHTKLHVGDIFFENNAFTFDLFSEKDLDRLHDIRHDKKMREEYGKTPVILRKSAYRMNFINSNTNAIVSADIKKEGVSNYLLGNDPSKWVSNVNSYEKLNYSNLYNGIDVQIFTVNNHLEYDYIIKPFAKPSDIIVNYDGVISLSLNYGILEIALPNTSMKELKPIAYQYIKGKKIIVDCEFVINGKNVSFKFPHGYDQSKELVIDPTWIFSTLTGSSADNWGFTATYDDNGNFYGGSIAFAAGFPVTTGAYDVTFGGVTDACIIKYNPTGTARVYSTYIGGTRADQPHSLVTNAAGELVILGVTSSTNFPTTAGVSYDATYNGGTTFTEDGITYTGGIDVFVAKLNAAGNGLLGSTYIGGSGNDGFSLNTNLVFNYADHARGEVVLDENDDILITSTTASTNYPAPAGSYKQTNSGDYDAVVSKLSSNLTTLQWSTYLGGSSGDAGYSIRFNESNNTVVVCGGTNSNNIGTTPGVIKPTYGGSVDGYVGVFNKSTGALNALTYLGTTSYDQAYILDIDDSHDIYVTGQSKGPYPVSPGVYSNANGRQFIHKMNNTLTSTIFSTIFGSGSSAVNISITAFLVDNCSNIYVAGWGGATNNEGTTNGMPITAGAIKSTTDGSDFYFIVLKRNATSLLYGTYFGSNTSEEHVDGGTSRFDKKGTIYQGVCAGCGGNNFPTSPGAFSSTNGSSNCNYGAIKIGLDFQGIVANADDPGDITLCGSPYNVNFNAGTTPPPNTFWDFGDGNTLGIGSYNTPMHTYADTGAYTVMYVAIDSSSCNIADTVYLNVTVINNGTLDAQINIPPYDPCDDSLTIQLAFTGSGADSIYWNMGNGDFFINDTLFNYTYTSSGNYIVSMQAYDFACGGYVEVRDTINFTPNYTAVNATPPGNQVFCTQPYQVTFDAGASPPPKNYWNFGDGIGNSSLANPLYTYADTGSYLVMYVAIDSNTCNIADTAYFNIQLIKPAVLDAQFTIPPYDKCQTSLTIQLAFTGTGADSLFWNMGNGATFIDSTSITYTYNTSGNYIVSFEAYDLQCNNSEIFTDTIHFNPTFTSVNAIPPADIISCGAPFTFNFASGTPLPPQNYWNFGDGVGTSVALNPSYNYAAVGSYNVMFVAIDSTTCNIADTAYFNVTLTAAPEMNVNIAFTPPLPCEALNYKVNLAAIGSGADSIYWNMGNGVDFVDSTSISYEYLDPGTYNISVTLFNFFCNKIVTENKEAKFIEPGQTSGIIPNVFTPNGDDWNDELVFVGIDHTQDYSIKIFDRWGRSAYESTDATKNWNGKNASEGTYFYELRYTDVCSSEEKLKTGTVTLLRGPKKQ